MKFIEDYNIDNKKVILRLDLNVTIKNNKILDNTKIVKSLKTINYCLKHNDHILIMSHLGKIKTEEDMNNNSLRIVCDELRKLLHKDIYFVPRTRGRELEDSFNKHIITMMENTRFEDLNGKKESSCDDELSKYWASLGDVFVNDAFGTTHRCHASNYGIKKYCKVSLYGFLIQEEINGLKPIISDVKRPFTVIMGGAKVDDKVALIKSLLNDADYLLVGGGIANTFLKASGKEIGKSLYSKEYVEEIRQLSNDYSSKIIMPIDVVVTEENSIIDDPNNISIDDMKTNNIIYDIGPNTISNYKDIIDKSSTIFLNGTVGKYEDPNYANGTKELLNVLKNAKCIKIAGGGDALASIASLHQESSFDYLSTGGGATLEYIATKKLACFEDKK